MRHSVQTVLRTVSRSRLDGIRNQILVLALLATLIPSLVIAVFSYSRLRRALTDKITQELVTAGNQAAREVDVWLKEHFYDLRVFANSDLVRNGATRTGRLADYLSSLQARFTDYDELQVLDATGRLVASSIRASRALPLPADWAKAVQSAAGLVGDLVVDPATGQSAVTLGVPLDRPDGRLGGALVGRLRLAGLAGQLKQFDTRAGGRVSLTTASGRRVLGEAGAGDTLLLTTAAMARLTSRPDEVVPYRGADGTEMIGSGQTISRTGWVTVAAIPEAIAYAEVIGVRNVGLLLLVLLLAVIGGVAYWRGRLISGPLDRLTGAAARVAAGDLTVGLPEAGVGELGYLTQVFNDMVTSLRTHQAELERLSTTDGLTGLTNRRRLITILVEEAQRARRYNRGFAVLMVDVDHFKKYNDTHGHQAGDEVLRQLAAILKECTRANDCAARYGGEEFLVMLSETPLEGATQVAERIRERMTEHAFDGRTVTLSIGLAMFPTDGDSPDAVISSADSALYDAKRAGRDRVVRAAPKAEKAEKEKRKKS